MLTLLTIFYCLSIISITRAIIVSPGEIPEQWGITSEISGDVEKRHDGFDRICIRCEMKKPDRAHHCRQCEKCVLKMDHHCNWIANCVGFWNYKYFICMLIHAEICIAIIIGSFWETVVVTMHDERNSCLLCLTVILYYSILCMLFIIFFLFAGFHFWVISNNYSTIEYCEKRKRRSDLFSTSPYNLGTFNNFKQALGENCLLWFIPTNFKSKFNGVTFLN